MAGIGWLNRRRSLGRRHLKWEMGGYASRESLLVSDTFTGADGTAISSRPPDLDRTFSGWQRQTEVAGSQLQITSNRCDCNFTTTRAEMCYLLSGRADVTILANMLCATHASNSINLVGRRRDANNSWHVMLTSAGVLALYEKTGGSYLLRAQAGGLTPGQVYPVRYILQGEKHTVRVNAVSVTYSSANGASATQHGMRIYKATADPTHLDDFKLYG